MQRKGFDYGKTFSPVAKMTSIRVILAVAAHAGWTIHQMDVNSAYLNGEIDQDILMSQPPGFRDLDFPNFLCLLGKSLYGIKQAGRLWYAVIKAFLLKIRFRQSDADPCVFIRTTEEGTVIIGLYVDDHSLYNSSTFCQNGLFWNFHLEKKKLGGRLT